MVSTRGSKRKTLGSPKQCFQCDQSEANTTPTSKGSLKADVNVEALSKGGYTTPPQQFRRCKSHARNMYHTDDSEMMVTQKKESNATENFNIRQLGNQTLDFQTVTAEHAGINSVSILQTTHESQNDRVSGSLPQTTVQNSTCHEQANTKSTGNTPAMSFNYTEFAEQNDDDDLSDGDSKKGSSSLICISGRYQVKPEYTTRLTSILAKHGDIGAKSSLGSDTFLSLYMEKLCDILQQLSDTKLCDITEHALKDMSACVCHIEKENVEVGWLKDRIEDIYKAKMELPKLKATSKEKVTYAQQKQRVSEKKEEYQSYRNEYVANEAEARVLEKKLHDCGERARDLRNRMCAAQSDICKAENEAGKSKEAISESKEIVRKVAVWQSLADGLV